MIEARSAGPRARQPVHGAPAGRRGRRSRSGPPDASAPAPPHASYRVLVVEDNDDERDMLAGMLSLAGHQVEAAADGLRAIEVARRFLPN